MSRATTMFALLVAATPIATVGAQVDSSSSLGWPRPAQGVQLLLGVHYSAPTGPLATVGVGVRGESTRHGWAGPFVALEPGAHGARLSIGAASVFVLSANTVQFRVTGMRGWSPRSSLTPGATYLGPEFRMTMFFLSAGVGRFWRVGSNARGNAAVYATTFGVAF